MPSSASATSESAPSGNDLTVEQFKQLCIELRSHGVTEFCFHGVSAVLTPPPAELAGAIGFERPKLREEDLQAQYEDTMYHSS